MLLAAGPYSTSDSLSYEPLTDLVQQIQQTKPDICILVSFNINETIIQESWMKRVMTFTLFLVFETIRLVTTEFK